MVAGKVLIESPLVALAKWYRHPINFRAYLVATNAKGEHGVVAWVVLKPKEAINVLLDETHARALRRSLDWPPEGVWCDQVAPHQNGA